MSYMKSEIEMSLSKLKYNDIIVFESVALRVKSEGGWLDFDKKGAYQGTKVRQNLLPSPLSQIYPWRGKLLGLKAQH